jgi:hypothetical protein
LGIPAACLLAGLTYFSQATNLGSGRAFHLYGDVFVHAFANHLMFHGQDGSPKQERRFKNLFKDRFPADGPLQNHSRLFSLSGRKYLPKGRSAGVEFAGEWLDVMRITVPAKYPAFGIDRDVLRKGILLSKPDIALDFHPERRRMSDVLKMQAHAWREDFERVGKYIGLLDQNVGSVLVSAHFRRDFVGLVSSSKSSSVFDSAGTASVNFGLNRFAKFRDLLFQRSPLEVSDDTARDTASGQNESQERYRLVGPLDPIVIMALGLFIGGGLEAVGLFLYWRNYNGRQKRIGGTVAALGIVLMCYGYMGPIMGWL